MSLLCAAFPLTTTCPLAPPLSRASRESSRSPDICTVAPWQDVQFARKTSIPRCDSPWAYKMGTAHTKSHRKLMLFLLEPGDHGGRNRIKLKVQSGFESIDLCGCVRL